MADQWYSLPLPEGRASGDLPGLRLVRATYSRGNIQAPCPDCGGALTTFEYAHGARNFYGQIVLGGNHTFEGQGYVNLYYLLLRCAGCGRGGMAKVHSSDNYPPQVAALEEFFPAWISPASLPPAVPDGIREEFREAERCAAGGAWRGGSALLRSVLEKTLKANGYTRPDEKSLEAKIDAAAKEGVITASRAQRAHQEIRSIGNDILHDDWQPVSPEAFDIARHYALRILEDFYDHRSEVETLLKQKGRI